MSRREQPFQPSVTGMESKETECWILLLLCSDWRTPHVAPATLYTSDRGITCNVWGACPEADWTEAVESVHTLNRGQSWTTEQRMKRVNRLIGGNESGFWAVINSGANWPATEQYQSNWLVLCLNRHLNSRVQVNRSSQENQGVAYYNALLRSSSATCC